MSDPKDNPEIARLEAELEAASGRASVLEKLLELYCSTEELTRHPRRLEHIVALAEEDPIHEYLWTPYATAKREDNPRAYDRGRRLWRELLAGAPQSVDVALRAARFVAISDPPEARSMLEALLEAPVDRRLLLALTQLAHTPADYLSYAERARAQGVQGLSTNIARALVDAGELDRAEEEANHILAIAKEKFRQAETEFAARDPDWRKRPNLQEPSYDWHHCHNVLGLVAARHGDLELAAEHLRTSLDIEPEFRIRSYGPTMVLAEELCHHDRWEDVALYLRACEEFWPVVRDRGWIDAVEAHNNPDFPQRWKDEVRTRD